MKQKNEQLVRYVKAQLEAGYDLNAIEHVLLKTGYKQGEVDAAIDSALTYDSSASRSKRRNFRWPKKSLLAIGAVVGLAVLLGIGFFAMNNMNSGAKTADDLSKQQEKAEPSSPEPAGETLDLNNSLSDALPLEERAVNESPPENKSREEEIIPDQWIGPPLKDPDLENVVLMPGNSAYKFSVGESAAITVKVFRTEYIASLRPKIECDSISQESFVTYEYEGNASVDEVAEVTFVFRGEGRPVFSECHFKLSATDAHIIDSLFYITVDEAGK